MFLSYIFLTPYNAFRGTQIHSDPKYNTTLHTLGGNIPFTWVLNHLHAYSINSLNHTVISLSVSGN